MSDLVSVSFVVPDYLGVELLHRLADAVHNLGSKWTVEDATSRICASIHVDDAAKDDMTCFFHQFAEEHSWIVPLHLFRNFGQHKATMVSLMHVSGDWVATFDENLRPRSHKVEDMLECAIVSNTGILYPNATVIVHKSTVRDLSSRTFKRLMQALTGSSKARFFSSFRLFRGSTARTVAIARAHDTYLDISLSVRTSESPILKLLQERIGFSFRIVFEGDIGVLVQRQEIQ